MIPVGRLFYKKKRGEEDRGSPQRGRQTGHG